MWCVLSFAHYNHCYERTSPTPVTCKNRNTELKQSPFNITTVNYKF